MKLPPDSLRSHSTSRLASHSDSHGMSQSAGTASCPAHPPEGGVSSFGTAVRS